MSKKSKKHRNGNHNQNSPQPVRIMPEHQSQTEVNRKPAHRWFPRIRAYVADCVAAFKRGFEREYDRGRTVYQTAKVEAAVSAARIAESAKPRVAGGRRMVEVDPRSPSLRLTGAALIVAAVWGPLGWLALVIGILLLVRPALLPRLVADGLAWAMAGAEEADRLLARAWAAVKTKYKVVAASVMVTATLFWAKVRARMAAPMIEAEPAC